MIAVMRNILIARRDALQTERRTIDLRRAVIDAQLDLLNDLVASLERDERAKVPPIEVSQDEQARCGKGTVRGSRLSERWACVVRAAVQRFPNAIKNDDAPEIQIAAGQTPGSREQVRTHVWVSTRDGLYEKINKGAFRATAKAAEIFNMSLGAAVTLTPELEAPNSSELFGAPRTNGAEPLSP